ncbi:MAG: AEC family transporter [Deferrisomatales bacterium]|nr:AEC family transporter [Deferrisomatales bacterium]
MEPLLRVLPVFAVILLGLAGRRWGLLPDTFQDPANRLAYYLAVPALIFLTVAAAPFREVFRPDWIAAALGATVLCWGAALVVSRLLGLSEGGRATFAQASIHSNLGYIGLAVAYYGLGDRGLQVAGVFAAFFMLLNNGLSVIALTRYGRGAPSVWALGRRVVFQPVILASLLGLAWSWLRLPLPGLASETLRILGSMGLPLALLLIGAGLSLETLRHPLPVAAVVGIKNLALPALGALFLTLVGAGGLERAAAVVLLGSPSATLCLVMAREMGGDAGLAAASVTASTLASAATLTLCLALAGP